MDCSAHARDGERIDPAEHFLELGKRHGIVCTPVGWHWPERCPINACLASLDNMVGVGRAHIF